MDLQTEKTEEVLSCYDQVRFHVAMKRPTQYGANRRAAKEKLFSVPLGATYSVSTPTDELKKFPSSSFLFFFWRNCPEM